MRAYLADDGIDSLRAAQLPPLPAPVAGQVRVAIRAASLNYRDLLVLRSPGRQQGESYVPLSDGAGEVLETGTGVWRVKKGDRVALTFHPNWIAGDWEPSPGSGGRGAPPIQGTLCSEVLVNQHELVLLPDHLSYEEGACLPCAAVTAWSALCGFATLLPGQTVLVPGTGGVAMFALQFAQLFGAQVIATTSSPEKAELLRSLGAKTVIDRSVTPEWHEAVLAATDGVGVDLVIELGGADSFEKSIAATRQAGRISLVGLLTGLPGGPSTFYRGITTHVIRVGSRVDFIAMNRAISAHQVRPIIDRTFAFEEAAQAFTRLGQAAHIGKIVIRV